MTADARPDPLILTAVLDPASAALFDRLRRAHFPAASNIVPAHLTLFHALPGADLAGIVDALSRTSERRAPPRFVATDTRLLGRGVAFDIDCPALGRLRKALAERWTTALTAQDRGGFRAHVTVQNKVTPEAARALRPHLDALLPIEGTIEGLALWHYRGGPWEDAGTFAFTGA